MKLSIFLDKSIPSYRYIQCKVDISNISIFRGEHLEIFLKQFWNPYIQVYLYLPLTETPNLWCDIQPPRHWATSSGQLQHVWLHRPARYHQHNRPRNHGASVTCTDSAYQHPFNISSKFAFTHAIWNIEKNIFSQKNTIVHGCRPSYPLSHDFLLIS